MSNGRMLLAVCFDAAGGLGAGLLMNDGEPWAALAAAAAGLVMYTLIMPSRRARPKRERQPSRSRRAYGELLLCELAGFLLVMLAGKQPRRRMRAILRGRRRRNQ